MSFKSTKQKYKSKYVFRVCFKGEDYLVNKMLDYSELDNNSFDEPFYFRSTLDELALYRYYFKKKYCTWQSPILNVRSKADENIILNYVAENNIFHSIQIVYSNDTLY
ncbi:hypothetical protein, partial [Bifidobacterium vespertilionis]|uniref:hypothetical protein n=1 Tax=Bifidobacterium vespertilionis TaxID=2562524 RepID=UPI001BDBBFEB